MFAYMELKHIGIYCQNWPIYLHEIGMHMDGPIYLHELEYIQIHYQMSLFICLKYVRIHQWNAFVCWHGIEIYRN